MTQAPAHAAAQHTRVAVHNNNILLERKHDMHSSTHIHMPNTHLHTCAAQALTIEQLNPTKLLLTTKSFVSGVLTSHVHGSMPLTQVCLRHNATCSSRQSAAGSDNSTGNLNQ